MDKDFIGLVHVPNITAFVLTHTIKDRLVYCSVPLRQCRGQAYNGASNMMSRLRGGALLHSYSQKNEGQFPFIVWHTLS